MASLQILQQQTINNILSSNSWLQQSVVAQKCQECVQAGGVYCTQMMIEASTEEDWSYCCDKDDGDCMKRWNCVEEEELPGLLGCHRAGNGEEGLERRQLDSVKEQAGANTKAIAASGAGKGDSGSNTSVEKAEGGPDTAADSSGGTLQSPKKPEQGDQSKEDGEGADKSASKQATSSGDSKSKQTNASDAESVNPPAAENEDPVQKLLPHEAVESIEDPTNLALTVLVGMLGSALLTLMALQCSKLCKSKKKLQLDHPDMTGQDSSNDIEVHQKMQEMLMRQRLSQSLAETNMDNGQLSARSNTEGRPDALYGALEKIHAMQQQMLIEELAATLRLPRTGGAHLEAHRDRDWPQSAREEQRGDLESAFAHHQRLRTSTMRPAGVAGAEGLRLPDGSYVDDDAKMGWQRNSSEDSLEAAEGPAGLRASLATEKVDKHRPNYSIAESDAPLMSRKVKKQGSH